MHADRTPVDPALVTQLFERHNESLVRQVRSNLRCGQEVAEDAVQFAWLQLYQGKADEPEKGIRGWLFTVARHEALAILNRRQSREILAPERSEGDDEWEIPVASSADERLEAKEVLTLLSELKPSQREALRLLVSGYTYAEIQAELGKTYTWVNRHVAEGRLALRKLIREREGR